MCKGKIKEVHKIEGHAFARVKRLSDVVDEKVKAHNDFADSLKEKMKQFKADADKAKAALWKQIAKEIGLPEDNDETLHLEDKYEGKGFYLIEEYEEGLDDHAENCPVKKFAEGTLTEDDLPNDMPDSLKTMILAISKAGTKKAA